MREKSSGKNRRNGEGIFGGYFAKQPFGRKNEASDNIMIFPKQNKTFL